MPLPDYQSLPNVSLDLPIRGKLYRAFGPTIQGDKRLRELFADPAELAKASKLEVAEAALGPDLFAELTADNVGWDAFERVVLTVIAWVLYSRELAQVTWETGVAAPAIIEHLKGQLAAEAAAEEPKAAAKPRTRRKAS